MARKKTKKIATRAPGKPAGGNAAPLQAIAQRRLPVIDALRGAAIVMMIVYHFSFDLNYFGVLQQNFYTDPFWITARSVILGSFLAVAGISLSLAASHGIRWRAYGKRLAAIAACAILVSVGSYLMFPQSWIYFGVLHFIFVAGILGLAFVRLGWLNLAIGAALIAAGVLIESPFFDHPLLNWFGLMTHKPITEDYVPLLPWFGVVLIGMFAGTRIAPAAAAPAAGRQPPAKSLGRALQWAGRHSLVIYMVHQPVLIGILYLPFGHRQ
jgi:uncharacterized membrane protein